MRKLDICDRCHFCAHSPHLLCAIHPVGVTGETCLDYRPGTDDDPVLAFYEPLEQWQPLGAVRYGDELVLDPVKKLTEAQQLELLNTHPLFTGRCPNCEKPMQQTESRRVHWDCEHCGWIDDSV